MVTKSGVSDTSKQVYHEEIKGLKDIKERELVLKYLHENGESTCSQISYVSRVDKGNIYRALNELWNPKKGAPQIEVSKKAACPITGRKVKFYKLCAPGSIHAENDLKVPHTKFDTALIVLLKAGCSISKIYGGSMQLNYYDTERDSLRYIYLFFESAKVNKVLTAEQFIKKYKQ